jgi:hypothetical protein
MTDLEWVQQELDRYGQEEETVKRLVKIQNDLVRVKAELAGARESLVGIRGTKREFQWQLNYMKEHGKLP